ncbi:MAG TPA: hypothetical protein VF100_01165, partial [Thermoanaerobaculia bacterium]
MRIRPRRRSSRRPAAAGWPALVAVVLLGCAAAPAAAQQPAPAEEAGAAAAEPATATEAADAPPYVYRDPLERDTPRGAMRGFLVAGREGDWERAARYLDLSHLPRAEREEEGPMLAQRLKRVLDRSLWVELDALADVPAGDRDEPGLRADRERVGVVELPEGGRA